MKIFFSALLTLIFLVVGGLIGAIYYLKLPINFQFFEKNAPTLEFLQSPKLIGTSNNNFKIKISDSGAGLDEVIVRLVQGGNSREIYKKKYKDQITKEDTVDFNLDIKENNLKEGELSLNFSVFDKSFFSNKTSEDKTLKADFVKPKVEILTVQHNGTVGGALFAMYRIIGDDIVASGVKSSAYTFKGSPAYELDPDFEKNKDIYFVFFPIPTDFNTKEDSFSLFVEDQAGNLGKSTFYQRIVPKKFKEVDMRMSRDFYIKAVDSILPGYLKKINGQPYTDETSALPDDELIKKFTLVNKDYRKIIIDQINDIMSTSVSQRLWSGSFDRPMPAAPTATFSEKRHYFLDNLDAGNSLHQGVDLAQTTNTVIRVPNGGKAVFADDLGIYGNCLIIDHGFSLFTMYGHLSSITVNIGDELQRGQELGRSGATGLAGGDHLHFEIRLHGIPINPVEWFDGHWIRDHVDGQIKHVKDIFKLGEQKEEKNTVKN